MDYERFAAKVAELEQRARSSPRAYQRGVILLALLGYAYLALLLAFLVACIVLVVASFAVLKLLAVKIALAVGAFVVLVVRALWVRIPPPDGLPVTAADAPALFERIDAVARAVGAPRVHRVLVTAEFNAGVTQVPRLGVFGWHRNYLLLGLPLLKTLDVQQLEAVLAHEFGHLAGGHARLHNWIYRLRASWSRLNDAMAASEHWGSFAVRPFFRWYAPYFAACSFPLARMNEYEADATAARVASARALGDALIATDIAGRWLGERYWNDLFSRVRDDPRPPRSPFAGMDGAIATALDGEAARALLARALARATTVDDTHPSLADRLHAIGVTAEVRTGRRGSASAALLGDALPALQQRIEAQWGESVGPDWARRHDEIRRERERLAELAAREAAGGALSDDELVESAQLRSVHDDDPARAIAQLRCVVDRTPAHAQAQFLLGRMLLADAPALAAAHLESAIAADPDAESPVCALMYEHSVNTGDTDAALRWRARGERAGERDARADAERLSFRASDKLAPHDLDDAQMAAIREALQALGVRRAWLARKLVAHRPEHPMCVLAFIATPFWRHASEARLQAIQERIIQCPVLPPGTLVFCAEGPNAGLSARLRRQRRARVV